MGSWHAHAQIAVSCLHPPPPAPLPSSKAKILYGRTPYQLYQVRVNLKVREREIVGVGGLC